MFSVLALAHRSRFRGTHRCGLKQEDSCNATQDHNTAFYEYGLMRDALNATGSSIYWDTHCSHDVMCLTVSVCVSMCTRHSPGRDIYFSLCGWNAWYSPVGSTLGNSWRVSGDCNQWPSVYDAIRVNQVLAANAGPGGWNVRVAGLGELW